MISEKQHGLIIRQDAHLAAADVMPPPSFEVRSQHPPGRSNEDICTLELDAVHQCPSGLGISAMFDCTEGDV